MARTAASRLLKLMKIWPADWSGPGQRSKFEAKLSKNIRKEDVKALGEKLARKKEPTLVTF
jgi:hypothetical protein